MYIKHKYIYKRHDIFKATEENMFEKVFFGFFFVILRLHNECFPKSSSIDFIVTLCVYVFYVH